MKRLKFALVSITALGVAIAAFVAFDYQQFLNTPVDVAEDGLVFEVRSGSSLTAVSNDLSNAGVIDNPTFFRLHAQLNDKSGSIQAGEYLILPSMSPRDVLEQFTSGDVRLYAFTIIEGWNRWELLAALAADPNLEATLSDEDWPAFLETLASESSNPEGLFLPETYHFPRNTSDRDLLRDAYRAMQKTLSEEWERRSPDAAVTTPYEALILASIIEKETARVDERARISGVFTRRLNKRMRLQTDPTVIYGLEPGFNGNITRRDLRTDTPYNTYRRGGLPPTPIAMPGQAAINAALNPAEGTELFFVATGLGDGSHKFSDTKEEHDEAVREYLVRLRKGSGT
ncbi:MAG: endolytic transglycosylase MltG [Woeseiaceae bacterium]|nr:endolytic transglycosylase MltG [Woeseiaceae bacterium]